MVPEQSPRLIEEVSDLNIPFLQTILQSPPISSFTTNRIGTGQVGEVYRICLTYASSSTVGPTTAILKIASKDPRSRSSGLSLGIYERETRFYGDVAPAITTGKPQPGIKCIPRCYYSVFEPSTGAFTLVLEDAGHDAEVGDDLKGATLAQARLALRELGRLHAALMTEPERRPWLIREPPVTAELLKQLFAGFKTRYSDRMEASHLEVCEKFVASFDGYTEIISTPGSCKLGVFHGDYRMDNMLFSSVEGNGLPNLTVVDWQLISVGPLLLDVAYFLGGSLKVEDRRQWTDELLQAYCAAMAEAAGEPIMSLEACKKDLRLQAFTGLTMAIVSSMMVFQTERGDDMFMIMLARACEQVKDLGSLDLLPPPKVDKAPLQPDPEDEQRHIPGSERDWNESWYFDFVDETQGLAGWVRLGLTPNLGGNWYHAAITRVGQPTVVVSDFRAPAPDTSLRLTTDDIEASHEVLEPLRKFRITMCGTGQAFETAADALQAKMGLPGRVELDLVYETDGVPYRYRLAPRYEIPCKVTGTVTLDGGAPIHVTAAPGQRDHSFGVRDWWAMDWVWSAVHLYDGQHIHATELRLFHAPSLSMGYVQRHGSSLEIEMVRSEEKLDSDGLTDEAMMTITAHGVQEDLLVTVHPIVHAPLRLMSEDGRSSIFDRGWGKVSLDDGRVGLGWFEWNRNER